MCKTPTLHARTLDFFDLGYCLQVAESVTKKLGIDTYFAGVLALQKFVKTKELQSICEFVAMTADRVNDAPALSQADVGISVR